MNCVLTLIANPSIESLSPSIEKECLDFLSQNKCGFTSSQVLDSDIAMDYFFTSDAAGSLGDLRLQISDFFTHAPFDVAIQPISHRRKKMLISDMDSTVIGQECIDELADECGLKNQVSAITERAMRGELEFESALIERISLLKGLPETCLNKVFEEKITVNPGAELLVRTMAAHGAHCLLVSGGFNFFTERIATRLGFHSQHANTLLTDNGLLTGKVGLPILGKEAKLTALNTYASQLHILTEDVVALGDGANDLPMIEAAGLGIAYYAKPQVAIKAHVSLRYTDLRSVLYIQGYSKSHFFGGVFL